MREYQTDLQYLEVICSQSFKYALADSICSGSDVVHLQCSPEIQIANLE